MGLAKILLSELEYEAAVTRKCIERFKDDQLGWKPHPKSMSAGHLISHLAEIPAWIAPTLKGTELDLSPPGGTPYTPPLQASVAEVLAKFDQAVAEGKEVLAGAEDSSFGEPWSLLAGGHTIFTMPRAAVMRSFVLSHMIHHRGQLSVYLRLLDIPVPSIYGPSADEQM